MVTMIMWKPTTLLLLLFLSTNVHAQISMQQIQNFASNAIQMLPTIFQGGYQQPQEPKCTPFKLPKGCNTFQDFCKYLSMKDDSELDQEFLNAQGPQDSQVYGKHVTFPLRGAVLGCLAGVKSTQRGRCLGPFLFSFSSNPQHSL